MVKNDSVSYMYPTVPDSWSKTTTKIDVFI